MIKQLNCYEIKTSINLKINYKHRLTNLLDEFCHYMFL